MNERDETPAASPDRTPDRAPDRTPGDAVAPVTGRPPHSGRSWTTRLILALVVVVLAAVGFFVATAFLPRWWAQRIGDFVDGGLIAGGVVGVICGFVFTVLPLLFLRGVVRRHSRWAIRLTMLVVAALLAVPNLTTLGIVIGTGNGAHAGQRIMDVRAPGFRGASLVGAIAGAVFVILLWSLLAGRRRRKRQLASLKAELKRREAADEPHGHDHDHDR